MSFSRGWEGRHLANDLARQFGVSAAIENDADAAALGEFRWGIGRGSRRFIYVTVSTGIGGGMIFDGQLYRGLEGCHPEIGHQVIDAGQGTSCWCGATGCWESLASGPALANWAQAHGGDPAWDARAICEAAQRGNGLAQAAVEREAHYLGTGLANLVSLFAPEVMALGGGVMAQWALVRAGCAAGDPANLRCDGAGGASAHRAGGSGATGAGGRGCGVAAAVWVAARFLRFWRKYWLVKSWPGGFEDWGL